MIFDYIAESSTLIQVIFFLGLIAAAAVVWNFIDEAFEKVFPDKPRRRTICKGIIILTVATLFTTTVAIPVVRRYIELVELSKV